METIALLSLLLFAGEMKATPEEMMNPIAESYVKLVLAVGLHDDDYVDAYFGPEEWRAAARKEAKSLQEIKAEASLLVTKLANISTSSAEEIVHLRREFLLKQMQSLIARVDLLSGVKMPFDEESKALYDAVAPSFGEDHFEKIIEQLDALLPGEGPLSERYESLRHNFVVPQEKIDSVLRAAIEECRKRTKQHIELEPNESFEVEYVTGKPWGGYNWYKGNSHSLIQINVELPVYIDQVLPLVSHEGYPGHHVYNALLESELLRKRNWIEFSVYPLFSPESLIAEGSADFGMEVLFSDQERVVFESEVLLPLAGIDPKDAPPDFRLRKLMRQLKYVRVEVARRYLDGLLTREQATHWIQRYALEPQERAERSLRFIEQYRSYTINYAYGEDLVRHHIESRGGTADQPEKRWQEFTHLLASPRLPSGLQP